jgi:hypothetical protein
VTARFPCGDAKQRAPRAPFAHPASGPAAGDKHSGGISSTAFTNLICGVDGTCGGAFRGLPGERGGVRNGVPDAGEFTWPPERPSASGADALPGRLGVAAREAATLMREGWR